MYDAKTQDVCHGMPKSRRLEIAVSLSLVKTTKNKVFQDSLLFFSLK